jgi:Rod binding domain-containing protein
VPVNTALFATAAPSPTLTAGTVMQDDPSKIHQAAQQFEALLLSELLKMAKDDSEGWLGTGDDETAGSAMAIAQEQFAQAVSERGGLGLATLIEKGLTKSTNEIRRRSPRPDDS